MPQKDERLKITVDATEPKDDCAENRYYSETGVVLLRGRVGLYLRFRLRRGARRAALRANQTAAATCQPSILISSDTQSMDKGLEQDGQRATGAKFTVHKSQVAKWTHLPNWARLGV